MKQRTFLGANDPATVGRGCDNHLFTEDYFAYNVGRFTLLALGFTNTSFTVQADSEFEWRYSTLSFNLHTPTYPYADSGNLPVTLQITDSGAGRALFFQPTPINEVAGLGREPYVLPLPRLFLSKSTVQLNFTSYDATNQWDNISFTMHGRKIFDLGPA